MSMTVRAFYFETKGGMSSLDKKEYIVSKILNNNVILASDFITEEELILVGNGIGFGLKKGERVKIRNADIVKSFIAYNEDTKKQYLQLINEMDAATMGVSEEIITLAEKELGDLNNHIHIALTDHIAFSIERLKSGFDIENPFLHEIQILYSEEFEIALKGKQIIKDRLKVNISDSEVGFIALHIYSARQDKKIIETMQDTRLLKNIIQLIQDDLNITIDNKDLIYSRLINHLKIAIRRAEENKYIENPLLNNIKLQLPQSYELSKKIGKYIEQQKYLIVREDELGYLALHIERIKRQ